jgi:hypothetical protein
MARDYVPHSAAQFNVFMRNLLQYVASKLEVWTNIPQARFDELSTLYGIFTTAFNNAVATPTPANHERRNEAQAQCTSALRAFVNQFLRFPPVTNADRIEMGIPNHDTIRTDHKVVTETVDFVLHVHNQREISVDFWQEGMAHKAKPNGYDGAVLVWDILDEPPPNQEALTHHTMASRTPFILHFDETERGKTVYVALQWQNERGSVGAWSDIKDAIVP